MTTKNIHIILIAVFAVLIVSVFYFLLPEEPSDQIYVETSSEIEKQEIVPPSATGNIDDIIDALMKELSDEESTLIEGENDVELIISDGQEISDFGQSIKEDEL